MLPPDPPWPACQIPRHHKLCWIRHWLCRCRCLCPWRRQPVRRERRSLRRRRKNRRSASSWSTWRCASGELTKVGIPLACSLPSLCVGTASRAWDCMELECSPGCLLCMRAAVHCARPPAWPLPSLQGLGAAGHPGGMAGGVCLSAGTRWEYCWLGALCSRGCMPSVKDVHANTVCCCSLLPAHSLHPATPVYNRLAFAGPPGEVLVDHPRSNIQISRKDMGCMAHLQVWGGCFKHQIQAGGTCSCCGWPLSVAAVGGASCSAVSTRCSAQCTASSQSGCDAQQAPQHD